MDCLLGVIFLFYRTEKKICHSKMSLEDCGETLEMRDSNKVFVSHKKSHLLAASYPLPHCHSSLQTQYRFSISIT